MCVRWEHACTLFGDHTHTHAHIHTCTHTHADARKECETTYRNVIWVISHICMYIFVCLVRWPHTHAHTPTPTPTQTHTAECKECDTTHRNAICDAEMWCDSQKCVMTHVTYPYALFGDHPHTHTHTSTHRQTQIHTNTNACKECDMRHIQEYRLFYRAVLQKRPIILRSHAISNICMCYSVTTLTHRHRHTTLMNAKNVTWLTGMWRASHTHMWSHMCLILIGNYICDHISVCFVQYSRRRESLTICVSYEYSLFHRALLQKRPVTHRNKIWVSDSWVITYASHTHIWSHIRMPC